MSSIDQNLSKNTRRYVENTNKNNSWNKKKIFIYFGGRKEKNYFFCSYFRQISLCFYSNFDQESSLDAELNSTSNEYPLYIILTDPATPKTRNTWKNLMMHPTRTHSAYFWRTPLPQKWEIPEKCDDEFFLGGVAGSVKSIYSGYSLDVELNSASNELSRSKFE